MLDKSITRSYTLVQDDERIIVEWDVYKSRLNLKKHKISFLTACRVFGDPYRIEYYDEIHSTSEERYIALGRVEEILFVVYTLRGEALRIISARLATKEERRVYYGDY